MERNDIEMELERADESADSREGRLMLLMAVLAVSVVVHAFLMGSLSNCEFSPLPASAVQGDGRKWSREVPPIHVEKAEADPLARILEVEPAPAAAPDAERQEDRVDRLAGAVAGPQLAPDVPEGADETPAPSGPVLSEPPPVDAAEWTPRQEIAEITTPTVPDEAAALPRVVIPKVERVKMAADVSRAAELPTPPSDVASAPPPMSAAEVAAIAAGKTGRGGKGSAGAAAADEPAAPPPAVPPSVETMLSGTLSAIAQPSAPILAPVAGAAGESGRGEEDEAAQKAAEKRRAEVLAKAEESRLAPPPASIVVDERAVERSKEAVRELRDRTAAQGRPFEGNVRLGLVSWADPARPGSKYFRIRVASRAESPLPVASKDMVFLLDASGSIGGDRLRSCRKVVSEALRRLNTGDRFNVIAFRDKFTFAFDDVAWKDVTEDALDRADKWLGKLTAHGQTDVFRTLRGVLAMPRNPARPMVALVVTDGDATSGLTRSAEIISRFAELNGGLVSIHMYGVKESANAYLMDMLTRGSRGSWTRHTGVRWRAASGIPELAKNFERPVLTDVSALFTASSNAETCPKLVSNLCEDAPIDIYGKCPAAQKDVVFSLRGLNGAESYESMFRVSFADAAQGDETIMKEWATRRLYEMVAEYVMRPNAALMSEMRRFAYSYRIQIPYERELK